MKSLKIAAGLTAAAAVVAPVAQAQSTWGTWRAYTSKDEASLKEIWTANTLNDAATNDARTLAQAWHGCVMTRGDDLWSIVKDNPYMSYRVLVDTNGKILGGAIFSSSPKGGRGYFVRDGLTLGIVSWFGVNLTNCGKNAPSIALAMARAMNIEMLAAGFDGGMVLMSMQDVSGAIPGFSLPAKDLKLRVEVSERKTSSCESKYPV
jgi:hypothetical protein